MTLRQSVDYPVLRRPQVTMGVGFTAATLIWSAGAMGIVFMEGPFVLVPLVLCALVHGAATWFFRLDHRIFEIYAHYSKSPDIYRAGRVQPGEICSSRPKGYAKGIAL
jgi:type IV secretory pathway VirB3-like protein